MRKTSVSVIAAFLSVVLLSGCNEKKPEEIMPDDTPWNSGSGVSIMETDSGYYINHSPMIYLRYQDKQTGKQIFLCNKPECMHEGSEDCTATYKNLSCGQTTLLYNNNIYFTGIEEKDGKTECGLYKVSEDGSSLDRVQSYLEIQSLTDKTTCFDGSCFTIHRGYAYIYYYASTQKGGYGGYLGRGFIKLDLKTGKYEKLLSSDDYFESKEISNIQGCGDYVYFDIKSNSQNEDGSYRYDIKTGEMSMLKDEQNENLYVYAVSEDKIYTIKRDGGKTKMILYAYDSDTLKKLDETIETPYTPNECQRPFDSSNILVYEGRIFMTGKETKVYENQKMVGEVSLSDIIDSDDTKRFTVGNFKISDGKLYCNISSSDKSMPSRIIHGASIPYMNNEVYCCSIDDIISGKAQWKKAYTRNEEEDKLYDMLFLSKYANIMPE